MAAGEGFKTFSTGDVLTASDANGYLMQGIWVFANATARDAAVTSPQEGNSCYLKDTDVIQVYSGSAWVVKSGSASPLTTKGDVYTYSTTDARLAVGTNGQVLTADSTAATGLAWATPNGWNPNYSLINAGGTALTGANSITISGISGKNSLNIVVVGGSTSTGSEVVKFRFNSDSTSKYTQQGFYYNSASPTTLSPYAGALNGSTEIEWARQPAAAGDTFFGVIRLEGTNSAGIKTGWSLGTPSTTGGYSYFAPIMYSGTSTISSITIYTGGGANFDAGTIYVYGA